MLEQRSRWLESIKRGINVTKLLAFAGIPNSAISLDLLLPACGFGEYQRVATVEPEGMPGTSQSAFMSISDGKIIINTQEGADIARKRTLFHMGKAAGSYLSK